jgi:hypothetical protein
MPKAIWSHNTTMCRATNFTPFRLMYGAEAVPPEELKHRSVRIATEAPACPSEVEEKDLLESDRLKVVANLPKYQEETRAWRDPKVKLWEFDVGNQVLLQSPHTESTGKFEAKWIRPYVVTEKTESRHISLIRSSRPSVGALLECRKSSSFFSFKSKL